MPAPHPEPPGGEPWRAVDLGALGFALDAPGDVWLDHLRAAEEPLAPGSIGPYELVEEVSRGGQGVVFRARQPGTERDIALKRLIAGAFASASTRRRFEREVAAAASLNHPGIVTVYGLEIVDGVPVLAMEWVRGVHATRWAAGRGGADEGVRRAPEEVLELFLRVCDAVQHAHARGVLHRDLKPSNILVDADDQPRVLDFGLAKRLDAAADPPEADLTQSAGFLGTPAYAAPEQLRGDELDFSADVFSLGVLLYEMLTGRRPWGERTGLAELMETHGRGRPPAPSGFDPRLDPELDTVVGKALAADRTERYGTVAELAEDLRRHLAGRPVRAVPPSSWYLLKKLARRNRAAAGLASALFLTTAVFAVVSTVQAVRLRRALDAADSNHTAWQEELRRNAALMTLDPECVLKNGSWNPAYERLQIDRVGAMDLGTGTRSERSGLAGSSD